MKTQAKNIPRILTSLVFFVLTTLSNNSAFAQTAKVDGAKEFEIWLDEFVTKNFPNAESGQLAFVLVKGDRIFFQKGYGFEDAEKKIPVSPENTVFYAASVGKVFTATAVMQLVEQNKIKLDEDINHYLKDFQIKDDFSPPITMANLLTHTGGLDENLIGALAPSNVEPMTMGEFFKRKIPVQVLPAGEQINYSNLGIGLAGHIVEKVSGMSFAEYAGQNIFAPLKMTQSSFRQPLPPELFERLAGSRARQTPFIVLSPAGSLAMTTENMAHFIIAQLNGGKYGDAQILQAETIAEMQTRHFSPNSNAPFVGYGFFETFAGGKHAIFHTGDRGHHSLLYLIPEEKIGFYLVFSGTDNNSAILREKFAEEFLNRYFPAEEFELPNPPNDFQKRAENFVGTYRIGNYSRTMLTKIIGLPQQISISNNNDGSLTAELFGGALKAKLVEAEPNLFRSDDKGYFTFQAGENGKANRLFITGGISDPMTAGRIAWYENAWLHLGLIIAAILLVVSRSLISLINFVRQRFRKNKIEIEEPKFMRIGWHLSAAVSWLILLVPVVLFAWLFTREGGAIYEIPTAIIVILSILLIAGLIGVTLPFWAVLAWKNKAWTLSRRIYFSLFALMALVMPFFLNYWNLLGFNF